MALGIITLSCECFPVCNCPLQVATELDLYLVDGGRGLGAGLQTAVYKACPSSVRRG